MTPSNPCVIRPHFLFPRSETLCLLNCSPPPSEGSSAIMFALAPGAQTQLESMAREGGRGRRHALPPALFPVPWPALTWELCFAQGKSISAPSEVGPKSPHLYFLSKIFSPLVQKSASCVCEVSAGHHKQKPAAAENSLLQIIRFTGSPQPLETPHLTQADNTAQEQAPLQHTATNKSRSVAGKCEGMLHSFIHLQPHLGHIATNYCFCFTCRLPLCFPG